MEQNQHGGGNQGRRQHFHRGRRGPDRRGPERRQPGAPQQHAGDDSRRGGEHVDVEHIMREIRSRISQRHGVELTAAQVHDLAARRLEAILDVRTVDASLLESLRKGAAAAVPAADAPTTSGPHAAATEPTVLDESEIFASDNAFVRFLRNLLKPIARLLFDVSPVVRAINAQARAAADASARHAERERRQSESNALQYELLVRMVRETSRISIEMESLALRADALAGRIDLNERRVRSMEGAAPQTQGSRQQVRPADAPVPAAGGDGEPNGETGAAGPDAQRRRRRRRRGRRGPGFEGVSGTTETGQPATLSADAAPDLHAAPPAESPAPAKFGGSEDPQPSARPLDEPAGEQ